MKWSLPILWACVVMLLGVGLLMMCSLTYAWPASAYVTGSPDQLAVRHAVSIALGLVVMLLLARSDYRRLRPLAPWLAALTLGLLLLVLIPGLGAKVHGARCFLSLGPLHLPPSALAGAALVLCLAAVLAHDGSKQWTMVALGFVTVIGLLVLAEPDFSTAFVLSLTALVILLLAGQRRSLVLTTYGVGVFIVFLLMLHHPVRLQRLLAFFSGGNSHAASFWLPWEAIKNGGWMGQGLGASTTLQPYCPDAATDFIAAVIGEELGGVALLVVALALILLVGVGFSVSQRVPDRFGRLLGFGICTLIAMQAVMHFAVVLHWLPLRGVSLPFVSHGGCALIVMLGLVGILLSLARSAASDGAPHRLKFQALENGGGSCKKPSGCLTTKGRGS